jgi:ribose transport system substrate-binding protein
MTHKHRQWLAPGLAIMTAALLAACSSASSNSAPSTSSSTPGASTSSPASAPVSATSPATSAAASPAATGLALAQQTVAQLEETTASYPVPSQSVPGVSKLKGKTVYYIPILQDTPTFVVAAQTMKQALAAAGLQLQVCNGEAVPSAIAACVQLATGAGAAGIVLDAIPYGMAFSALNTAVAKGIPVLVADQVPDPASTPNTDKVSYLPGAQGQASEIAWWTIADSGGKANEIIAEEIDNPSSIAQVTDSLGIYKDNCPACHITVKQISATTTDLEASEASADLLADPDATYFYTEFEDSLQPTVQGIQQSGKTGISLSVAAGTIDGLGLLKGGSLVKAVVVVDEAYEGWALTDEILRMATKSPPVSETIPTRLFTKQNISSIQVTAAAQTSGVWFGSNAFESQFAKLWGVG